MPIRLFKYKFSFKSNIPEIVAPTGPRAQKSPALSAVVNFWARGCRVKPKPVHIIARPNKAKYVELDLATMGLSKIRDPTKP